MILSHKHKFIFFCNGRTGTTSIEKALEPLQEGAEFHFGVPDLFVAKHVPPAILKGCLPDKMWQEYFKFVFVRNPWDWFLSQWRHNLGELHHRPDNHGGGLPRSLRGVFKHLGFLGGSRPQAAGSDSQFTREDVDFLFEGLKRYRGLPGRDGLYQSSYAHDVDGHLLVDYVGRFENLQADFLEIAKRIGVATSLPHLNRTEHRDYRLHFSPQARQRVGELWALDVRNFNYAFE